VIDIVQLSECGDIDPSIRFGFEPLWTMDEKERAEVQEIEARTDETLIRARTITRSESRRRVATDVDAPYQGLDVELDVPMSEVDATDVASKLATLKLAANEAGVLGDQATLKGLVETGVFPEITPIIIAAAETDPPAPNQETGSPVPDPGLGVKAAEREPDLA